MSLKSEHPDREMEESMEDLTEDVEDSGILVSSVRQGAKSRRFTHTIVDTDSDG